MSHLIARMFLPVFALTSISNGYTPPSASCQNLTIPVRVTSNNYPWTAPKWTDNFGLIDFVSTASSRVDAGFPSPFGTPVLQNGSYEISATFCIPKLSNAKTSTVLLATHGLAFDRKHGTPNASCWKVLLTRDSYWNSPYKPDQYNFVQYATQKGYSVFFYDRLGVGGSSKVSGFANQLNIQISVLSSLVSFVRSGPYPPLSGSPKSIVLVGHSFGSFLSNSLVAAEPTAVDAVIMTGHGLTGSSPRIVLEALAPRVANLQHPKFAAVDAGYVTTADVFSNINNFFKAPDYEHDVAAFSESTKQPFAIAELINLQPPFLSLNATAFRGPALVISGEYDFILCGGYCPHELEPTFAPLFGGAKDFETYVQPLAGHGLNFARNATGVYGVIFEYLARNGL